MILAVIELSPRSRSVNLHRGPSKSCQPASDSLCHFDARHRAFAKAPTAADVTSQAPLKISVAACASIAQPERPRPRSTEQTNHIAFVTSALHLRAALALQRPRISPAIDQDVLPDDVAGMLAAQERADRAELLRRAEAAAGLRRLRFRERRVERHAARACIGLGQLDQAVGLVRAGQQVVDRDVVFRDLARQAGDEAGQAGARAVGEAEARIRATSPPPR